MVERRKRKPLVLSSTKALVDSLLNSHRTAEDGAGIDETDPSRTLQLTAGILRVSDDSALNSVDASVSIGLSTAVLKQLSITSGSLVLINNVDANVSRIGQAVVLDPPNPDDGSSEHGSVISHAPRTMLIFPSYAYPQTQSESLDHQVAYVSPILAFNLNLHQSCLKNIVQQGGEKLSSLFVVKPNDEINEKENEPNSVRIGLESWAKMPIYASHLRASFVKIPECGTLERLKTWSSEEAKDRQSLIDLALNDYFSVDRYLARGDLFSVCIDWNCKSELCIPCNQKMPNPGEHTIYFKVAAMEPSEEPVLRVNRHQTALVLGGGVPSAIPPDSLIPQPKRVYHLQDDAVLSLASILAPTLFPSDLSSKFRVSILLHGVAGSGKRTVIRYVAHRLGLHVVEYSCHDFMPSSEKKASIALAEAFSAARRYSPAILLLRHFEIFRNLAAQEGSSHEHVGVNSEVASTIKQFTEPITEDKNGYFDNNTDADSPLKVTPTINQHPVLLVATVDNSEGLPPIIRRCFSHEIKMGSLSEEQRSQLLSQSFQHISDLLPDTSVQDLVKDLVGQTSGFMPRLILPSPLFPLSGSGTTYHLLHSAIGRVALGSHTMRALSFFPALCILLLAPNAFSFYLPGVAPEDFQKGDPLNVKVNKLTSIKTQLPYSYYSLPYCHPNKIVDSSENLGEVLRGDRIENSPYVFKMGEPQVCNVVCRVTLDAKKAKAFKEKIQDEYRVNMILDNLPLVVPIPRSEQEGPPIYQLGHHVGLKGQYADSKDEKYFIYNHLSFTVKFHRDELTDSARIVGFEVIPFSVKHEYDGKWNENAHLTTCDPQSKRTVSSSNSPQEVEDKQEIIFTYDVAFQESDVKWASRWDTYLLMTDDQIHWFSIVNSLMIVLFLSGMVAMIMLRTLYRDISKYNELETQEEAQEETGWKLVHADVFRPPSNSDLLCVYVGTGVQFLGMMLVTMVFAVLGFLSPSNRGGLMTAMLFVWVFMGLFAGYSAARIYKMFKGTEWKKIALQTAFLFPGLVFGVFFVLNALIWGQRSSGAVPFGTMFALVFLWFGISVPLVVVGSYVGFKKPAIENPVKTNKIPRQIPEQPWYMNPIFSILIGGILPFGAVFIELFFILTSIWLNQFYYIFGFLFIVFIILLITCAEITIVLCYFQLCSEDYLWWWRSYLTSGSSALYLFLYATFYFFTKLEITKPVSGALYFGYMLLASYSFFVLTGTIGFYACFVFTRLIYSSVKID